jgi:hypothetical protein
LFFGDVSVGGVELCHSSDFLGQFEFIEEEVQQGGL